MQVVLLAGGLGTRIQEESHLKPKPMIEIGGYPILWHIMQLYSAYGFNDFIICLGYKGYLIKEYFANYLLHASDVTIDTQSGDITYHQSYATPWRVTLLETGALTMTGGRLKRISDYLEDRFCVTYGDGVADVDIRALLNFHAGHGRMATMTSVMPPGRYGAIETNSDHQVEHFLEKPRGSEGCINGGFFVMEKSVLDYIEGDETSFEKEPLENLVKDGNLMAFRHDGFWHAMDTMRDRNYLEELWTTKQAPWKVWAD
jgi:glucose-1-phosphate cytidylyltransferase